MRTLIALAALLCTPSLAFAQSKVYTNADLDHPQVTWTRSVTPEEWAGLQARQTIVPPPDLGGPRVYVLPYSGEMRVQPATNTLVMAGSGSSADDLWRDPVTAYAIQHPIEAAYGTSYRGARGFHHASGRSVIAPPVTSPPLVPTPRPSVATAAAGGSRRVR